MHTSPLLSPTAQSTIRQSIDTATAGLTPSIPGVVYCAVNRDGDLIFSHASGSKGLGLNEPMALDTTFWIASCTKMITGIACMQLVEQGKLALDDAEQVERIAPELKEVQVLQRDANGGFILVPKERKISLRMLLNHTAGFGYAFDDVNIRDWSRPIGVDDFSGNPRDVLGLPLVNQPGTQFQYGVNIDWVGLLVERVANLSLDAYFKKYIFDPIGVKDISFFPTGDMKRRLVYMHHEDPDGRLRLGDHPYRAPLISRSGTDVFCAGGAGCFGVPAEYCKLIAVLLNDGTCPKTNVQILKPETIQEMFRDQIPDKPRNPKATSESANPDLQKHGPVIPGPADLTEGWGLTFALSHRESSTGRAKGSAAWEGIANLFWFADRENGIGGMIASQILPYGRVSVLELSESVETAIYKEVKG